MRSETTVFQAIAVNLAHLNAVRKMAVMEAFEALERYDPDVAAMLIHQLGDRSRAASWMCISQRSLEGRTAYEALAEGDQDVVWDLIVGEPSCTAVVRSRDGRPAKSDVRVGWKGSED